MWGKEFAICHLPCFLASSSNHGTVSRILSLLVTAEPKPLDASWSGTLLSMLPVPEDEEGRMDLTLLISELW
jgi:hypothetical protein